MPGLGTVLVFPPVCVAVGACAADARAPETCSHPLINKVCEQVPVRIICYTHADLLSQADLARVMVWTERIYGGHTGPSASISAH